MFDLSNAVIMIKWRCLETWRLHVNKISTKTVLRFMTGLSRNMNSESKFDKVRVEIDSAECVKNYKKGSEFKLNTPEFKGILTEQVSLLQNVFIRHGYELRIAGGAVRDLLLGLKPKDLDFATTATPDEMKLMLLDEGIRMINESGEKHGTVTARIEPENFEITTLRVDKVTNGRHADVEFIRDWELDANRRDFTINSMFLDLNGIVYDYCDGLQDLNNRCVRFVGHPAKRITEDYLRILRYFRFVGRISKDPFEHNDETIRIIKEHKSQLDNLSGERVWSELKKTVDGNFGPDLLHYMLDIGLGPHMGFPVNSDLKAFADFRAKIKTIDERLEAISIICALLNTQKEVLTLRNRLKISNFDRDCALFVIEHRDAELPENHLRYFRNLVVFTPGKTSETIQFVEQVLLYRGLTDVLKQFRESTMPVFPVKGNTIRSVCKVTNVRHIGVMINELKRYWAENDFKPTEEELLEKLPKMYVDFQERITDKPPKRAKSDAD